MIQHGLGLLVRPTTQWRAIAALDGRSLATLTLYPCIMAILPAVAWFYGTSQVGWTVGDQGDPIKLTAQSARQICLLFYLGMVACVVAIGYFIHWMSDTYGANSSLIKGVVVAAYTATPLFIAGLVGIYPILWLDMLVGVVAVSWAVYLLYLGTPIVMGVPPERGFLYASAVFAVALVSFVALLGATVVLWDLGTAPEYTY